MTQIANVSPEIAELLHKTDFDAEVQGIYIDGEYACSHNLCGSHASYNDIEGKENVWLAPNYEQVRTWIRDNGWSIVIDDFIHMEKLVYDYKLKPLGDQDIESSNEEYSTYYHALDAAILKYLKR